YVRNPQVTVVVTGAGSSEFLHRVRVTGAVQNPASLPFQKGMTIMDLVLVSGGLTEFADANSSKLYRVTPEGTKVYPVRLKDILDKGDIKTNYPVLPGDIVTIPEKLF
ncbi:MAG TPA: SLBB domain-containing protein, partial [Dongiaceae bacterium]|nr:SLBB domain-containing protein [Dongiaceae bacterium]